MTAPPAAPQAERVTAQAKLRYVSLFSGIGGFDLGFDRAGMTCVAQVEFNPQASEVLSRHWPDVMRFKDVRDVGASNLPNADVLVGGFPCQDVSVAGRRAGLAGERSGLWFEFLRILTELKPQFCVIENVPGLLSSNEGRDFAVILRGLVECGYRVAWRILDAQYFGVAQRRRRVFIVASLGTGRSAEILFERESGTGNLEARRETRAELAFDVAASLRSSGEHTGTRIDAEVGLVTYRMQRSDSYEDTEIASTVAARDFKSATDLIAFNVTFCDANGRRKDRPNGGLYVNETAQANTLHAGNPSEQTMIATSIDVRNLRSNGDISGTLQSKKTGGYSLNYQNPVAIHAGNGADLSPSLTNNAKGFSEDGRGRHAFALNRHGVRRLTPTECERLQGFPDGHTTGQSDSTRYKQLGNAVCVNVAEWLGKRIASADVAAGGAP